MRLDIQILLKVLIAHGIGVHLKTKIYGRVLMELTTHAQADGESQQTKNGMQKVTVGAATILPVLLPHHLNCLLQADAATALGRSSVWVHSATIGQAVWMAQALATCILPVGMPTCIATTEQTVFLSVALRIKQGQGESKKMKNTNNTLYELIKPTKALSPCPFYLATCSSLSLFSLHLSPCT